MNTINNISLLGKLFLLVLIGTMGFAVESSATHIVGGDMTYKCLGNDRYEVTLRLRRDCLLGSEEAQFDDPAVVGIFSSTGTLLTWFGPGGTLLIPFVDDDTLNTTLESDCGFLGSPVCVQQTVYKKTIKLPPRPGGYILAYQRCCRNISLNNIEEPELTGSTYWIAINDMALAECNSSPEFDEWADIYICANQPISFTHAATDPDGDELVYSLCTPSQGATFEDNTPLIPSSPPYETVTFSPPYSESDMMGGTPFSIDPQTGELSGTPNIVGQFLIGICVDEYRNGVKISSVRRDFEYNVRECGSGTLASFTSDDVDCEDLTMSFENTTDNADSFIWSYVDSNNDTTFVTNDVSPTITFPALGTYTVILEAVRDSDGCISIVSKDVTFKENTLEAAFTATGLICNASTSNIIDVTDMSVENDGNESIIGYSWTVTQDGVVSNYTGPDPTIEVANNNVATIDLVVSSSSGCTSTATQSVGTFTSTLEPSFTVNPIECGAVSELILTDTSTETQPGQSIVSWSWTAIQDGVSYTSTGQQTTIELPNSNDVEITLVVTSSNGCAGQTSQTVTSFNSSIDASFTVTAFECAGTTALVLTDTSVENQPGESLNGWSWTAIQDGITYTSTGEQTTIELPNTNEVEITLVVTSTSGCMGQSVQSVDSFNSSIDASFTAEAMLCGEMAILSLTDTSVENQIGETVNSWEWTVVQNGITYTASGQQVMVELPTNDEAVVTLVVGSTAGCEATVSQTVDPGELDDPSILLSVDMCNGALTVYQVQSESTFPGQIVSMYEWTIDVDGTVITGNGNPFTFETDGQNAQISLKVTFESGCEINASQMENLEDAFPDLAFGDVIDDCVPNGNVIIALFDQSVNPIGFNPTVYTWFVSNGTNTDILTGNPVTWEVDPNLPTNAVLTVEYDNNCILESEVQEIQLNNALQLQFTGDPITACVGDTVFLIANPNNDWTYDWDPLDGLNFGTSGFLSNPFVVVTGPATYSVTVSDGLCDTSGSVSIEIITGGPITVTGDTDTCDGMIELTANDGAPGSVYNWSYSPDMNPIEFTGEVFSTTIPPGTTTVYVQAVGGSDCDSDILAVELNNNELDIEIVQPFMICRGDTADLIVLTNQVVTFEWEDDIHIIGGLNTCCPTIAIGPDEPNGSFMLNFTAVNDAGCMDSFTYEVIIVDNPELSFTYELGDCGTYTVCFTNTTPVAINGIPLWDFGDGNTSPEENPCHTYDAAGTYDVTFSTISALCPGVPMTQTIEVPEIPEVNLVGGMQDTLLCFGEQITIMATSNLPEDQITWCDSNGAPLGTGGTIVITAESDLVVIAKVEDANGCMDESETYTIDVYQFDVFVESSPSFICVGGTDEIVIGNNNPGENLSYTWSPAECIVSGGDTANPTITALEDKTFTVVIVNNDNGCMTELSTAVSVSEPSIEAITDVEITLGDSTTIEVVGTNAGDDILWSNGSTEIEQVVSPTETTTYVVTVTDENGCTATDDVTITVRDPTCDDENVFLPTAFSPNGDGANDALLVRVTFEDFIETVELTIYDRWGEEIYKSASLDDALNVGWDGRYKNESLSSDVYGYCLKVRCLNEEEVIKVGNVSLLK